MEPSRNSWGVRPAVFVQYLRRRVPGTRAEGHIRIQRPCRRGNTIVHCSKGHLFTTIWVPGASFKSIKLGLSRFEHCPVGHHWALVTPVKDSELTDEERRLAGENHDVRIP